MYIVTAIDENDVVTRLVIGCITPASQAFHTLELAGYDVEIGEGDAPERDDDEVARAQVLMLDIFDVTVH